MKKGNAAILVIAFILLAAGLWYLFGHKTVGDCRKIYDSRSTEETFKVECPNGHWYWISVAKEGGQDFVVPPVHADDCPVENKKETR